MARMARRPLTFLLATLLAIQSSLAGVAICLDGGGCHHEEEATHLEHHGACGGDHGPGEHQARSTFVTVDDAHPCGCTDQEIAGSDAIRGLRDELPAWGAALAAALPADEAVRPAVRPRTASATSRHERGDPAGRQRAAILRSTRLLI